MIKGILKLGLGLAAFGIARFFVNTIAEERKRRDVIHHEHEKARWEGEGGNPVGTQPIMDEI